MWMFLNMIFGSSVNPSNHPYCGTESRMILILLALGDPLNLKGTRNAGILYCDWYSIMHEFNCFEHMHDDYRTCTSVHYT